jgi:SPP1 family predicted phage head-tail adaptor
MAYDVMATLYIDDRERDDYGQPVGEPSEFGTVWCEATYSGGSRRTYAGRLAAEHTVVLTTRWRQGIEKCAFVEVDGIKHVIAGIVPEGRRYKIHITYIEDEIGYGS